MTQEEIEDIYVKDGLDLESMVNPFEYLLALAYKDLKVQEAIKEAFNFFTREPILFNFQQKNIIIGDYKNCKIQTLDDLKLISEDNYFDFQNAIRESIGNDAIKPYEQDADPRIRAIKAKARYRDKVKAKTGKGLDLFTVLSAISCMGNGLNPLNIGELSYAALPTLIQVYQEKEKYGIDIESLLAGADSKKVKPKYWIRNLNE